MSARFARMTATLAVAALLTACVGSLLESKQPVETVYVLAPPHLAPATESLGAELTVPMPHVAPGLEGARIAVLKGRELNYYAGARWGADLAQLVQSFTVRTLASQGAFRSVAPADMRVASVYALDIEVTHFQAEYADGGAPQVHVAFIGRLVRVNDRTLVDTLAAESIVAAESNRMGAVVAAFEAAARKAATELGEKVMLAARGDAEPSGERKAARL